MNIDVKYCPECGGKLIGSEKFCSNCGHQLKTSVYLEERKCLGRIRGQECGKLFKSLDVDSVRKITRIHGYSDNLFYCCPECLGIDPSV